MYTTGAPGLPFKIEFGNDVNEMWVENNLGDEGTDSRSVLKLELLVSGLYLVVLTTIPSC